MSTSEVDRVNNEQNSASRSDDWDAEHLAQYDENGVPRTDERLSDSFPEEFALYC